MKWWGKSFQIVCIIFFIIFLNINVCLCKESNKTISQLWEAQGRLLHQKHHNILSLEAAKKDIKEYFLDNGITRSHLLAAAYVIEARNLLNQKDKKTAIWALRSALEMDPTFLPAARMLLKGSLQSGFSAFFTNIPQVIQTYYLYYTDTLNFLYFTSDFILVFFLALLIFLAVNVITFSVKYMPLWVHEIEEHLPNKIQRNFSMAIVIVILLLPVFLHLGFVWLILWLLILSYVFLNKSEVRIIWFVLLPLLVAIPANILRTAIWDSYNQRYLNVLQYAEHGGYSKEAILTLKDYQKTHKTNNKVHFILGLLYKRGGHYFEALREYLEYTRLEPRDPKGHINLGNIYFILNNINEAVSEYRRAENLDRNNPIVYFNLSRAYLHQFKFEQATEILNKASQLDPDLVTYYTEIHSSNPNRLLIDSLYSKDWILEELPSLWAKSLAQQDIFWYKLGPGLGMSGTTIVILSVVFILLVMHAMKGKFLLSRYCIMCGQAICHRCQEGSNDRYCNRCQMMFFKKSMINQKEREKMLREIAQRSRRKWTISLILSILMPGSGNIHNGEYKKGIFLLAIWSMLVSIVFTRHLNVLYLYNVPHIKNYLSIIFLSFVGIIIYSLAVLTIVSGEDH